MADNEFGKYARKQNVEPQTTTPKVSVMDEAFGKYNRGNSQSNDSSGIRWGEVAMDAAGTPVDLAKSIWGAISNAKEIGQGLGQEMEGFDQQTRGRKLKNLGVGALELSNTINQAPANIVDYFKRKGAPEDFGSSIKRPEKIDWKEYFNMGEQQPGDALTQGIGTGIPLALLSGGGSIGASIVGGIHEAGENRNPLTPGLGIAATNAAIRGYQGIQNMRGGNIANQTLNARNEARSISNQNYNDFDVAATQAGVPQAFQAPRIATEVEERILNNIPGAYTEHFENYINNGNNFNDALRSVSDLRGYASKVRNMTNATPEQISAGRAAWEAAESLDRAAMNALSSSRNPNLANELQQIRTFHANEVIPYKPHGENFNLFERDRINPEVLISELKNNPEFMHMLSDRFSGFRNRDRVDLLKNLAKIGGVGGAVTGAGMLGYNALFGGR
jgi:hypothetical protein